jgi:Universal stress protein family
MKRRRVLLPFTHGVSMSAIEQAVRFAKREHAVLVALSLIPQQKEMSRRLRLEHVQQSKDFLEAVRHKAARHGVQVEPFEVYTEHPVQTIKEFAHEHHVSGVLIFVREGKGVLLSNSQIKHLMEKIGSRLYIVALPPGPGRKLLERVVKRPMRLATRLLGGGEAATETGQDVVAVQPNLVQA